LIFVVVVCVRNLEPGLKRCIPRSREKAVEEAIAGEVEV